jgi:hypothetical protein
MAHVTFIHGIANKTAPAQLERAWVDALRDSDGPDLLDEGVSVSMAYWADVLYPEPIPESVASTEAGETADVAAEDEVDLEWLADLPPEERDAVRELASEAGATSVLTDGEAPGLEGPTGDGGAGATDFERVPLPGPVKRRLMQAFLRDVHHYLWNTEHSPRPGEVYRVRDEVRARALAAMSRADSADRPHVLVGHSLGSVVAYDVLKNVPEAPMVDGLMTLGSPLGLDEVQDRLDPGWSRWDGHPAERLSGAWVNVFDRLDPVCGFDPVLANDFRRGGVEVVTDVDEANWGTWRHSLGKYFRGDQLRSHLAELLDIA